MRSVVRTRVTDRRKGVDAESWAEESRRITSREGATVFGLWRLFLGVRRSQCSSSAPPQRRGWNQHSQRLPAPTKTPRVHGCHGCYRIGTNGISFSALCARLGAHRYPNTGETRERRRAFQASVNPAKGVRETEKVFLSPDAGDKTVGFR